MRRCLRSSLRQQSVQNIGSFPSSHPSADLPGGTKAAEEDLQVLLTHVMAMQMIRQVCLLCRRVISYMPLKYADNPKWQHHISLERPGCLCLQRTGSRQHDGAFDPQNWSLIRYFVPGYLVCRGTSCFSGGLHFCPEDQHHSQRAQPLTCKLNPSN